MQLYNKADLDKELASDIEAGFINGAHWYRTASLWYRLNCGYGNALTFGRLNSEWLLINSNSTCLAEMLAFRTLVFFGIGIGDAEMTLVDFQLDKNNYSESILIDINPTFLKTFIASLAARSIEDDEYDIKCLALKSFFEGISDHHIKPNNSKFSRKAIVCLGSTIGNYGDTSKILSLFDKLACPGDIIILGYQLSKHLNVIFSKYKNNDLYCDIVGNFLDRQQKAKIEWRLNREESTIEAWYGKLQVCRSKKFNDGDIKSIAASYNWQEVFCSVDSYKNMCLQVFEKK